MPDDIKFALVGVALKRVLITVQIVGLGPKMFILLMDRIVLRNGVSFVDVIVVRSTEGELPDRTVRAKFRLPSACRILGILGKVGSLRQRPSNCR